MSDHEAISINTSRERAIAELVVFGRGNLCGRSAAESVADLVGKTRDGQGINAYDYLMNKGDIGVEHWDSYLARPDAIAQIDRHVMLQRNIAPFAEEVDEIVHHPFSSNMIGSGCHAEVFALETKLDGMEFVVKRTINAKHELGVHDVMQVAEAVKNITADVPNFERLQAVSYSLGFWVTERVAGKTLEKLDAEDVAKITDLQMMMAVDNIVEASTANVVLDDFGPGNIMVGKKFSFIDYYTEKRTGTPAGLAASNVNSFIGALSFGSSASTWGHPSGRPKHRLGQDRYRALLAPRMSALYEKVSEEFGRQSTPAERAQNVLRICDRAKKVAC